jgi:hypothetical protein
MAIHALPEWAWPHFVSEMLAKGWKVEDALPGGSPALVVHRRRQHLAQPVLDPPPGARHGPTAPGAERDYSEKQVKPPPGQSGPEAKAPAGFAPAGVHVGARPLVNGRRPAVYGKPTAPVRVPGLAPSANGQTS